MVARFRRALAMRPINRIKHVVDRQGAIVAGTSSILDFADTVDAPTLANTEQVETGSSVKGLFLRVEVYATSAGALANAYFMLYKNVGGNTTPPNPNAVGGNDNKRFVLHQEMVMLERKVNGNPRTLFKGVLVIPKGMQRMAPNDKLQVILFAPGITAEFCWQAIYKEWR